MLRRLLEQLPTVMKVVGAALLAFACSSEPPAGEVVLLISTDLSVPSDVDTLRVTVARGDRPNTLSEHCYWLDSLRPSPLDCELAALPGTIALVSDDASSGLVQVHLELRKGGADGPVRVQRDAKFQIPSAGVKQVPLRLDFLCLEAGLSSPCEPGTTCQLGSCVDAQVGEMAEFSAPSVGACFDVARCFEPISDGNTMLPKWDSEQCAVRGMDSVHVNVALIVNAAVVGNYGVCEPRSGTCLVPLDQGPNGWTTYRDSNGAMAIGLPKAVCDGVGTSISGVVVAPSAQCGVKREPSAACQADPICVPADRICPEGWSGSSCSDLAVPTSRRPDLCGRVKADPEAGAVVPGLWCCNETDPPERDPLLIDDMTSGPELKIAPVDGNGAGAWFTFTDDGNAVISPPPYPALFTYRDIEPAVVPAVGEEPIRHAACLRSNGVAGTATGAGFDFMRAPPHYLRSVPLDVSRYTGIRFWAYSVPPAPGKLDLPTQIRVQFENQDTRGQDANAPCIKRNGPPCDPFGQLLTLPIDGSWVRHTIKWSDLSQSGFGEQFDHFNSNVFTVGFVILPSPGSRSLPFDFCVAQIEFTQD